MWQLRARTIPMWTSHGGMRTGRVSHAAKPNQSKRKVVDKLWIVKKIPKSFPNSNCRKPLSILELSHLQHQNVKKVVWNGVANCGEVG
jgi:hypothetical protein